MQIDVETSLIQTIGRAARNADGKVIMYADNITASMRAAIQETERRRKIQSEYNEQHGIVPKTIFLCALCSLQMPLGLNTIVIPSAYGKDASVGASMAIISHLLAVLTIPLMFAIIQ